jgi:hypothetical protein
MGPSTGSSFRGGSGAKQSVKAGLFILAVCLDIAYERTGGAARIALSGGIREDEDHVQRLLRAAIVNDLPDVVFIGLSARTNLKGAYALQARLATLGRRSRIVETPRGVVAVRADRCRIGEAANGSSVSSSSGNAAINVAGIRAKSRTLSISILSWKTTTSRRNFQRSLRSDSSLPSGPSVMQAI